jgi:hypothetical protein
MRISTSECGIHQKQLRFAARFIEMSNELGPIHVQSDVSLEGLQFFPRIVVGRGRKVRLSEKKDSDGTMPRGLSLILLDQKICGPEGRKLTDYKKTS